MLGCSFGEFNFYLEGAQTKNNNKVLSDITDNSKVRLDQLQ